MNRSAIVRLFLEHGTQVDQSALTVLENNPEIINSILTENVGKLPSVITIQFLESFQSIKQNTPEKISVDQLAQVLSYRYEFLRNLLLDREELVNLTSINKISGKIKQFSIIGIVSEINGYITVEDSTGHTTFKINKTISKHLVEDEVVGLVCENIGEGTEVKEIVYPDIPLQKENNRTGKSEKCIFISDIQINSEKFKYYYRNLLKWLEDQKDLQVFVLGGISKDSSKLSSDISHPVHFYSENEIRIPSTFKIGNIQLLISNGSFLNRYMNLWKSSTDITIIQLLKKRNLNPILSPESYNNNFLLETIPDIIVLSGTQELISANYKGTTILTTSSFATEPIYWLTNLQTREIFKIDLS